MMVGESVSFLHSLHCIVFPRRPRQESTSINVPRSTRFSFILASARLVRAVPAHAVTRVCSMDSPVFELVRARHSSNRANERRSAAPRATTGASSARYGPSLPVSDALTARQDGSKVAQFARGLPGFAYDEEKPYAEVRGRGTGRRGS